MECVSTFWAGTLKEDVMRWSVSSVLNGSALSALCHFHSKIHKPPQFWG